MKAEFEEMPAGAEARRRQTGKRLNRRHVSQEPREERASRREDPLSRNTGGPREMSSNSVIQFVNQEIIKPLQ